MLKVTAKKIFKIIAIAGVGLCACVGAIFIYVVAISIFEVSSADYESDRLPEIIKASQDGKYLAKLYNSNWQPPFWTLRPLRAAGVYIQRIDTKQEWLIAKSKHHDMRGDVVWRDRNSLLIFSSDELTIKRVDIDGETITVKVLPTSKN